MPSQRNIDILDDLLARLSDKQMIITMRYENVSAGDMDALRQAVRQGGGLMYIAKNTLVKRAADRLGLKGLDTIIDGPTGYITVEDDVAGAANALVTIIKDRNLEVTILGGMMNDAIIDAGRIEQISQLPSRDELIGRLAASMNSPLTGLLRVMSAPIQGLAQSLQQVVEQKQAQEAA